MTNVTTRGASGSGYKLRNLPFVVYKCNCNCPISIITVLVGADYLNVTFST